MRRSLINLFAIVVILASLIGSGIRVTPVEALGSMVNVPLNKPPSLGWKDGYFYGVWGASSSEVFAVGSSNSQTHDAPMPMIYYGSGYGGSANWTPVTSPALALPSGWGSGTLTDVWGSSATNVYAVGYGYNGTTSTTMPLLYHSQLISGVLQWTYVPLDLPVPPAPASPWTFGRLNAVWGTADGSNIYIVGYGDAGPKNMPLLYHYYSGGWHWEPLDVDASWIDSVLYGVWGSPNGTIYAVGYGNTGETTVPLLYRYDGTNWNLSSPALPQGWTTGYINAVWGSANNDIYAAGSGGPGPISLPLLYHSSDGIHWIPSSLEMSANLRSVILYGIWGANGSDVYAVGSGDENGKLLPILYRKAGTKWVASSSLPSGSTDAYFESIWGSGADDVYAVGNATGGNWGNFSPMLSHAGIDTKKPSTVTGFTASPGRLNGTVKLTWYAPFDDWDDPNSGPVDSYIIKQSKSLVSDCSGGTVANVTPVEPGQLQAMKVSNLDAGAKYYFAICARDELPNQNLGDPATSNATANVGNLVPEAVTLVSPSGSTTSYQPTFTWNADLFATWYYLWVNGPSGPVIQKWYTSAQANCSATTCSVLLPKSLGSGAYTWWVQTWNDVGLGQWSVSKSFTLARPSLPGQATALSPAGAMATSNPTYTWSNVPSATWYYFMVNGPSGNVISKWYSADQVDCGASTCSLVGATPGLISGAYSWWVQTWNETGTGLWSDTQNFNFALPGKATLSLPSGNITTNNPTYTWSNVPSATSYYLWVNGPGTSGPVIQKWFTPEQAACSGSTCSITTNIKLRSGEHTWWVQTWNEAGYGPWSSSASFTVPVPPLPGKVTLSLPAGATGTSNPTYTWSDDPYAIQYNLVVNGPSGTLLNKWYTTANANCDGTTCSVAGATPGLTVAPYSWSVTTWNDAGNGPSSNTSNFNVVMPGQAILSLPAGAIGTNSPTYTWNDDPYATWYHLMVNGPSGNLLNKWYTAADANCNGSTCTVAAATPGLAAGSYMWWVQTWNEVGTGPWSDTQNFSFTLPGKAILSSPAGGGTANNPTYTWGDVPGSTWYYLWVEGPSGNVIKKWYSGTDANCNGTTCSVTGATPGLVSGSYMWWVQTWNELGTGPWSDGTNFVVP